MTILGLADRLRFDVGKEMALANQGSFEVLLSRAVQEVNTEVYRASAASEREGMGTTLTVALLMGSEATIAHIGDSRAYLFRDWRLRQLTQDHTVAGEALARGIVDAEHAKRAS